MSYFKYFPQTTFQGKSIADITRKAKLNKLVTDNVLDYMSYTIQEGEKPEDIAYNYYDDPNLAWLVLMSNDIIDPYQQWPMTTNQVEQIIINKYSTKSGKTGTQVLDWAKNTTIASNIVHYRSIVDNDIKLNRSSFIALGNSVVVSGNDILVGEDYVIMTTGSMFTNNWETLTGINNYVPVVDGTFTAQVNGSTLTDTDTFQVRKSSLTNPAREFQPVRVYDYEIESNEAKREIQLINKGYLATIKDQLETILIDG